LVNIPSHFVIGMVARVRKKPAVKVTKKPAKVNAEKPDRLLTLHTSFVGCISREKFKEEFTE